MKVEKRFFIFWVKSKLKKKKIKATEIETKWRKKDKVPYVEKL